MTAPGRVSEIDNFVGARIRERRRAVGLSQRQVADQIGVGDQDITKYERGVHRISAGRLYEIARALNTPIAYFFEGIDDQQPGDEHYDRLREIELCFGEISTDEDREKLRRFVRKVARWRPGLGSV